MLFRSDYRFANNEEDYVVDTWEWFDLSPLGAVHTISFSLSSTKGNAYGMLTPAYFCIDDFNGEAPLPPTPPQGIDENNDVTISVYPNPAHDFITVETTCTSSLQRIDLYSVTGQLMLSSTETEINVSTMPEGIYFATVFTENQKFVERIIVK